MPHRDLRLERRAGLRYNTKEVKNMPYQEMTIQTDPAQQEILQGYLYTFPIGGLVVEDPADRLEAKEHAPEWVVVDDDVLGDLTEPVRIRMYVENTEAEKTVQAVIDYLGKHPEQGQLLSVREVDEESWAENWKQFFKPIPVGRHLLIKPSWEETQEQGRIVIEIDPGMAFGTGTHETTRLCLEALEQIPLNGMRVADIGCGSGILSIAAALLGASLVQATDIDPVSLRQTQENAEANGVRDRIHPMHTSLLNGVEAPVNVLVSNILAEILIDMIPDMKEVLAEQAFIIFSGVITEKKEAVKKTLANHGYRLLQEKTDGGWVLLVAERIA